MAAITSKGFHAPIGADPVEPSTGTTPAKLVSPTDVALLAAQVNDRCVEYEQGLADDRPTAGVTQKGKAYRAEDTGDVSLGGTADWLPLGSAARAEYAAGAASTGGAWLAFGAPTQTVAGVFSRDTHETVPNALATVTKDGLYDVSLTLAQPSGAGSWDVLVTGITDGLVLPATCHLHTFAGVVRLDAGEGIAARAFGGSATVNVERCVMRRVGP